MRRRYINDCIGDFNVWDGTSSSSLQGSGTESNPYLITSGRDLSYFSKQVTNGNSYSGKYIKVTNNIDLNNIEWVGIGSCTGFRNTTTGKPFSGIFDGGFNIIRNINIQDVSNTHRGLFNFVKNGTIKNLVIENIYRIIKSYGYIRSGQDGSWYNKSLFIGYPFICNIDSCIFKDLRYEISSSGITGTPGSENICELLGQEFGNISDSVNGMSNMTNCFIYNVYSNTNSNFMTCGYGRYSGNEYQNGLGNCYLSGEFKALGGEKEVYPIWHFWNNGACWNCGNYLQSLPRNTKWLFCGGYGGYITNNVYDSSKITPPESGRNEGKVGKSTKDLTNGSYVISENYEAVSGHYPQLKVFKNNSNPYIRELSEISTRV